MQCLQVHLMFFSVVTSIKLLLVHWISRSKRLFKNMLENQVCTLLCLLIFGRSFVLITQYSNSGIVLWMFVLDHFNYAFWLPVHLNEINQLHLKAILDSQTSGLEILTAHAHYKIPSDFLGFSWRMSLWKASDWTDFDDGRFPDWTFLSLNSPSVCNPWHATFPS